MNGNSSAAYSSDAMRLAAVGLSLIREIFPMQQADSDEAAKLRLELMAELAEQVGEQRFVKAVRDTIKVSHRRWDCSIARIREMAGLKYVPEPSAVALAWRFVTDFYLNHVRPDPRGTGNYVFEEKVVNVDGVAKVTPVPEIPPAISRALRSIGGWAAIAEGYPEYHAQRYKQFQEFYSDDEPGPRMDLVVK